MLSPLGLAPESRVAPRRLPELMFGGWVVATAIGNKLKMIGVYRGYRLHSSFRAPCGILAVGMGVFLLLILLPLKKAMPGV